jgi:hypothetical protein
MIARENRSKSRSAESEQSSGWFERLKHCTEVQLEAAESTSCPSKFVSDLPGWEDSNFDVMRGDRSVRGSQCGRDGDRGEETVQPNGEDHSPSGPQPSPPGRLNPNWRVLSVTAVGLTSVAIALAFMSETNPSNPPRELKIPLSRAWDR